MAFKQGKVSAMQKNDDQNGFLNDGDAHLAAGLYIVATPIGHARDISLRALDVLAAADLVLCEDTRVSQKLFSRYRLKPHCLAYHEHNAEKMRPKILARLAEGETIALISDAGTPLISDPGMPLVRAARAAGHYVSGVPGASAPMLALSIAGLPTDRFCFAGFLPPKKAARQKALSGLLEAPTGTLVLFESAKRLVDLLADIETLAPQAEICVTRELTKKFEQVISGTPDDLQTAFAQNPPRGEVTLLISAGRQETAPADDDIDAMLNDAMAQMSRRDAVQNIAAETGLPRKQIYARALALTPSDKTNKKEDVRKNDQQKEAASDRPDGETKSP